MKSDTIIYLVAFMLLFVLMFFYMKGKGHILENWAGFPDENKDNQFISNQTTTSDVQTLNPAETDALTSLPNIDGAFMSDAVIDSSTILPSNDGGNLPPMLLSPDQQIGKPSPPSKISFLSGGDIRAIPCVSKGDQSQFPFLWSSYEPKDMYGGGFENIGRMTTCG